jgi:ferredoxin
MKIVVDWELCESNLVCVGYCPEVFEVNDKDELIIHKDELAGADREDLELAVRFCPRGALTLVED